MAQLRTIARTDAARPIATREQRRFPMGWSSVDTADLAGVPKRTVQDWRKTGFFVPWLPESLTGHPAGELYSLNDVLTLRLMRMVLGLGADREIVARFGEEFPVLDPEDERVFIPVRGWAAADVVFWCLVPLAAGLLEPPPGYEEPENLVVLHDDGYVRAALSEDDGTTRLIERDGAIWWVPSETSARGNAVNERPVAVWLPLTELAQDVVAKADQWRRQRRIPLKTRTWEWPDWM